MSLSGWGSGTIRQRTILDRMFEAPRAPRDIAAKAKKPATDQEEVKLLEPPDIGGLLASAPPAEQPQANAI